jgi:hypothetical protein
MAGLTKERYFLRPMINPSNIDVPALAMMCASAAIFGLVGRCLLFFVGRFRDARRRALAWRPGFWAQLELQMINSTGYLTINRFFGALFLTIAVGLIVLTVSGFHPQ